MRLLLDTCAFLWAILDSEALSRTARDTIRDPANDLYLSAVSGWEVALKQAAGRLELPEPARGYLPRHRQALGVESLALDEASVLHLPSLPVLHRDPFDRMLVCQAIAHGLVILTPDRLIADYPIRTLW